MVGVWSELQEQATAKARTKYGGLSTAAAWCAAFGRDDASGYGSEFDAVFAYGGEDGPDVGEFEEFADAFADVDEFEGATGAAGRDVEAHEGAQAHAVHEGEVGEVEDDAFGVWDEFADVGVEDVGEAGDEFTVAADDGGGALAFDVEGEVWRSGWGGGRHELDVSCGMMTILGVDGDYCNGKW